MSTPLISVVMAAHNGENYVAEAVTSILNQTFSDFEFLIVDDGSTDTTPAILASFNDKRMHVTRRERGGLTTALINGLGAARGEFVARMDADDICEPKRLETQLDIMSTNANLALVGTWFNIVDEAGVTLAQQSPPSSDSALQAILPRWNPFCHGSVLMRREAVTQVGGYRPQFHASQDYDLWLRLSEHFQVGIIPEVLYSWRLRRNSVGTRRRMLQRAYGKAARACAQQRRDSQDEKLPQERPHPKPTSSALVNHLLEESTYEAFKANILLTAQRGRAVSSALRAIIWAPWNAVAWAALLRTLTPSLGSKGTPYDRVS